MGGVFRNATAEVRMFYAVIALAIAVVASMTVYQAFWRMFLRLDFFYTRFLIVALVPQSTLVALIIARLRQDSPTSSQIPILVGLTLGIGACIGVYFLAGLPELPMQLERCPLLPLRRFFRHDLLQLQQPVRKPPSRDRQKKRLPIERTRIAPNVRRFSADGWLASPSPPSHLTSSLQRTQNKLTKPKRPLPLRQGLLALKAYTTLLYRCRA